MKYLKLYEKFDNSIKFEIIGYKYNESLLENNSYYEYKENRVPKRVFLDHTQKQKLRNLKNQVDSHLLDINNFEGNCTNNQGHLVKRFFEIKYTNHWLLRFLRKDIEDPIGVKNIKEPGVYEGIDLIHNNKDKLTEYINNQILRNNFRVLVKATNREGYELIFDLEKSREIKKGYIINFITQMKGLGHNYKFYNPSRTPINRIIKLNSIN